MKEAAWQEWRKYNDTKYVAKAKVTAAVGDVNDRRKVAAKWSQFKKHGKGTGKTSHFFKFRKV